MPENDLIEIGRVVKAHGIKGELCIDYNAESPELPAGFVYLRGEPRSAGQNAAGRGAGARGQGALKKYDVKALRMHKGRLLLTLNGVSDRTEAELMRNFAVLVPKSRLPELSPDEIYLRDLPGLEIYLYDEKAAGRGDRLGRLETVADTAGQEIWSIAAGNGKEILFPANEEFVKEINPEKGYAVISPPPGLIELYLE